MKKKTPIVSTAPTTSEADNSLTEEEKKFSALTPEQQIRFPKWKSIYEGNVDDFLEFLKKKSPKQIPQRAVTFTVQGPVILEALQKNKS